ncbi:MAG: cytochrome c peroxidase, partial [Rubripirellula sp.]
MRKVGKALTRLGLAALLSVVLAVSARGGGRPSAMALGSDTLLVVGGNSIYRISVETLASVSDATTNIEPIPVGKELTDVTHVVSDQFVVADAGQQSLIGLMGSNPSEISFRCKLKVVPNHVRASVDGRSVCVSSTWDRAAQIVRLSDSGEAPITHQPIPLGFEPGWLLALPNHRFLVADAFGNHLAVIDANKQSVVATHTIQGHQIRGLTLSADSSHVLLAHQLLSRVARTDRDDIHWGSLIQSVVSKFPLAALDLANHEFRQAIEKHSIGDTGEGFADPVDIAHHGGSEAVLSMGARQLLIRNDQGHEYRAVTGRRPIEMIATAEERLVVLNEQDGTLSVFLWDSPELEATIVLRNIEPPAPGEVAFFDANLSHDRWLSCNSCHVDGHTPGLLADTFGDGTFRTPKRIPTLLGVADTPPYGWTGNRPDLESQIAATIESTMRGRSVPPQTSRALSDYLRQLRRPIKAERSAISNTNVESAIHNGQQLFKSLRCVECHQPPHFTSSLVKDVGLQDERGHR